MRQRIPTVACLLLLCLLAAGCGDGRSGGGRPVILVTLDTTRADRIGCYSDAAVDTPNLDAVAGAGVLFEQASSQVPLTLPAHSSILTGRYPASHGVRHNGLYSLPEEAATLAESFREAGFETAAFIGAYVLNRGFGTEQGFDVYDDIEVDRFEGGQDRLFEAERTADEVNEAVFRWLESGDHGDFFLWVHYFDPHAPYAPPEEGRTLQGTGYDREISYTDACLGDLVRRLDEGGWLESAVLAVVGDHGESLGEHGEATHGVFLYECAVRVPMMIRAPGRIPPGTRVDAPVGIVDLAPTLLELAELPPLPDAQGESLVPLIDGRDEGLDRLVYAETLMGMLEFGWSDLYMVRDVRYKYVEAPRPELYDLVEDPAELRNLAEDEPVRAAEMAGFVRDWKAAGSAAAVADASRTLSPEEEERLRSLGYLGGDSFRTEEEDEGRVRPDPKDCIREASRLVEARRRMDGGDVAGALPELTAILRANPGNHKARTSRIMALSLLGRYREAEEEALAGISLARTDPGAPAVLVERNMGMLATTYRMEGRLEDAERVHREILDLNPESEESAVDLAGLLVDDGRPAEAVDLAQGVLDRNPRHGLALAVRFLAEEALGRAEQALATAEALADVGAGDPATMIRAGDALMAASRFDPAAECYGAALGPGEKGIELPGKYGTALLRAGRISEAGEVFHRLVGSHPEDPRPRLFLGMVALAEGREEEARGRFDEALERDSRFTVPLLSLANWLASQGRIDEARETLQDAVRRDPADPRARRALERLERSGM